MTSKTRPIIGNSVTGGAWAVYKTLQFNGPMTAKQIVKSNKCFKNHDHIVYYALHHLLANDIISIENTTLFCRKPIYSIKKEYNVDW